MSVLHVYPGSFSPPTRGHENIVRKAEKYFGNFFIICSENPNKKPWFTPEECREMWRLYKLPYHIPILTLREFESYMRDLRQRNPNLGIAIIRGLRSEQDMKDEMDVMTLNHRDYGIELFTYMFCDPGYTHISSSAARLLTEFPEISGLGYEPYIHPDIVPILKKRAEELNANAIRTDTDGAPSERLLTAEQVDGPGKVATGL